MPYVMNLTHYLDETGNIPKGIPAPARRMGSFLALLVDEVTRQYPETKTSIETTLQCLNKSCKGELIGALDDENSPVCWYCLDCGDYGKISDWQNTRWDNTKSVIQPVNKK
jgi:hypothetical protein